MNRYPRYNEDVIEINRKVDGGGIQYTQIIVWEWSHQYLRHRVCWWSLLRDEDYCLLGGDELQYRENGKWYVLKGVIRHTWTRHDPERDDRKFFEEKYRRGRAWNMKAGR